MATYRELLARVRTEIDEISTIEAHERHRAPASPLFVDVRESEEWEEGHVPGAIHVPRGRLESRIEGSIPDKSRPLVVYCSVGARSAFATKVLGDIGLRGRRQRRGRVRGLEAERLRRHDPACAHSRAALALQPPPPDPRGRRGRPAAPARRAHPPRRRRRARLARVPLPRGRGCRHARHRRRRRRRRVEPPAPDRPLDGQPRRAEGDLRETHARGAQPGRPRDSVPGAADLRERRANPRRGLGRDRRRRRQLPDPLPRERRLRVARDPGRARLDLPLRGPGHGVRARRRARATAASSPSRRRRSSPRAAPRAACSASCRGSSGRCRRTRR